MSKVIIVNQDEEPNNPFSLSIGDLMAALLLIFVLLLSSTLLRLEEEFESVTKIADRYVAIKKDLYQELIEEFQDDLVKWNAELDSNDLLIRFSGPKVEFDFGSSVVKPEFKNILENFFPRYVDIISDEKFKDNIEEIRIEGHTDNISDYYTNMRYSQDRTRSVLKFVLEETEINNHDKKWLQFNLTANGLSYSKPISDNNTELGRNLNRRVEFRVRTNAEKQIDEILSSSLNE